MDLLWLTFLFEYLVYIPQLIFGRRWRRRFPWLVSIVDPDMSVTICEFDGPAGMRRRSDAYNDVKAYLGKACSGNARHLMAESARNAADELELGMRDGEEVADKTEGGATVWWSAFTKEVPDGDDVAGYRLYFQECDRVHVLRDYLKGVRRKGRAIIDEERQRMIMTNTSGHGDGWTFRMLFNHPKTFETLAMDSKTKQEIIDDLETFKNGREYYANRGKPWKRGYLLYGPPGTGKSSMVAAMANYLKYDVYDMELTSVISNTELPKLMIGTKSKSIIVIEDIDCSLDLTGAREDGDGNDNGGARALAAPANGAQEKKRRCEVTLSGLLNFIDGLWSACGEERIIVFTTNHVDRLDPALIRRGRMDKRIEMSYCGFEAFKFLAKLYHKLESHRLFRAIERLLGEVEMTPADVAENLTLKSSGDNADSCLQGLVRELKRRRAEGKANGARIADDAARAVPQGATEQGLRRSPRRSSGCPKALVKR